MSELNNALSYPVPQPQVVSTPEPQRYRSELEYAIVPNNIQQSPLEPPQQSPQPSTQSIQTVHKLLQFVQTAERDTNRRIQWEQQADARHRDSLNRIDSLTNQLASVHSQSTQSALVFSHYNPPPIASPVFEPPSNLHYSDPVPPQRIRTVSPDDVLPSNSISIHQVMRHHILASMGLDTDQALPPSHTEGVSLPPSEPARFIWEKTTRQSVHNTRMKSRIIKLVKDNQINYGHLPTKDFGARILDASFEQQYKVLRQKYAAQMNVHAAIKLKKRSDYKALKARHSSRRKNKLKIRTNARLRIPQFEHPSYDSAFNQECMSSEESDVDEVPPSPTMAPWEDNALPRSIIRIRGHPWRSAKLIRMLAMLDESEETEKSNPSRTGPRSRLRVPGPVKDGFYMPPQGIAQWMVSQRWIHNHSVRIPNLQSRVQELFEQTIMTEHDIPGMDLLGEASDAEQDETNIFIDPAEDNNSSPSSSQIFSPLYQTPYSTSTPF